MVNAPTVNVHAPMAQPPAPHGRPHPGLADQLRRLNINLPHMQQQGQQGQQGFARREGTPSPPRLFGFLLTRTKVPGIPESWERIQKEVLLVGQDQLGDEINKEKKKGVSAVATYKGRDMDGYKRSQVDRLIEDLTLGDPGCDFKLVLLKLRDGRNQKGQRVTASMRIILKRQLATDDSRTRIQGLDSQTVDINQGPPGPAFFTMPTINHFPPPPPAHRGPQPSNFDQPWRIPNETPSMKIPEPRPAGFNSQHDRFTPPSGESSPVSDRSSPPLDYFQPRPGHAVRPEEAQRFPQAHREQNQTQNGPFHRHPVPGNLFDRPDFLPGGRPGEQANKSKTKDDHAKAGEQKSKGNQVKNDRKDHQPYLDQSESDYSDAVLSDDSGFSRTGTNRSGDVEVSDHRRDKRTSSGHRDGYRSVHGSPEEDQYARGHRRDHAARRRDSLRSSHSSHEFDNDFSRPSIRQHRRMSPLRSANSSTSSGSLNFDDEKIFTPHNSRGTRRGSECPLDERPWLQSRHNREVVRPPRRSGMYSGKRLSSYNHPVDIVYDKKEEMKETVRAQVKQELNREKIKELTRENERLKEERSRPEPIMNDRERFSRGPVHTTPHAELPRSRRFPADLQSYRYPYCV